MLSDFDLMLQKKKEEQTKRKRRKDIDIINDNDDIIAQLIGDMKGAAEVNIKQNFFFCIIEVFMYLIFNLILMSLIFRRIES